MPLRLMLGSDGHVCAQCMLPANVFCLCIVKVLTMRQPIIEHHGAKDGVTGSCHQLHVYAANSLLIDGGLFQGAKTSGEGTSATDRLAIEFPLDSIKALVDPFAYRPCRTYSYLLAAGFKGSILCSEPSAKLLPIVLEDAFKPGFSRDQKQVERYIRLVAQRILALPYKTWVQADRYATAHGQNPPAARRAYSRLGLCGNRRSSLGEKIGSDSNFFSKSRFFRVSQLFSTGSGVENVEINAH